jgi:hypothetical protein
VPKIWSTTAAVEFMRSVSPALFTVWVRVDELVLKLVLPLNTALIVSVPAEPNAVV